MRSALPAVGISRGEVFARMKAFAAGDIDWRRGRVPLYVFKANDEIAALRARRVPASSSPRTVLAANVPSMG